MSEDFGTVLGRLRPDWDPDRAVCIRRLSGGYANDNFAFEYDHVRYVLRIVRTGVPGPVARARERDLLVGPLSSLTASVVAHALPEGHLLSRFVDGDLLVNRGGGVADLCRYLAALHDRLAPFGWRYPIDQLIGAWFDIAARGDQRVDRRWLDAFAALPPSVPGAACHNDLNPWNVIVRGASPADWCTLDWEWCGDNDPFFDVVGLARGLRLPAQAEDDLIDCYADARGRQPPGQRDRRVIRTRFHLREIAWALATMALRGQRAELNAQVRDNAVALDELIG